ncbi:unnamed protein product [Urochloa humidicola]
MHDLVRDLAVSLLGNQIMDQRKQGNNRGSSCQYALLSDCRKPLESCFTSRARLVALRFLDGCRSKLSGAAITRARSLRVLDLRDCCIKKLPNSIGQLKQLRYLNVPGFQIETIRCITKLSDLIYVNLHYGFHFNSRHSKMRLLPESIGQLGSLMFLDLSNWKIEQLPDSFKNLNRLLHLDLSSCPDILGVPESLQSMSRLEHLNLSGCGRIGDMTRAMSGLTELQYLNLSHASCFGLQVMVKLTKLRYLNLSFTVDDIEVEAGLLLDCVSSLSNLEYLNLAYNRSILTIPESFGKLRKLNTLDLTYCSRLQTLPASLSAIDSLKFLHVSYCNELDMSNLPQRRKSSAVLPNFVVHAGDFSSNLYELEDKHATFLDISKLENVKSAEEARRLKLSEKQSINDLELAWTKDAKRFVDDVQVLSELLPPETVKSFKLQGYNGISFPSWMMSIATYLPLLGKVVMQDLPSCNVLPPLGQLPNLNELEMGGMDSIRKIDGGFYGGRRAFPQLGHFTLSHMELLEEWKAPCTSGEDGLNELAFPRLDKMDINHCPLLRFREWLSPCKLELCITGSDKALLSSWENRGHVSTFSAATTRLSVARCEAPLHQWNLLRHLPCLEDLEISDCYDLTCGATDLLQSMSSIKTLTVRSCKYGTASLLERLEDLTSLTKLKIFGCKGIKAIPDSIQQLRCLKYLEIDGCPELVRWCLSEENEMKLAHIKEIILNGKVINKLSLPSRQWG